MAYIYGRFESQFRDEPTIVASVPDRPYTYLGCHDIHTGNLVLGRCLGDSEGAEVYRFDNLSKDRDEVMRKIGELLTPKNVYMHLLPWFESEAIPFTLDTGEPGGLTIVHRPDILVATVEAPY